MASKMPQGLVGMLQGKNFVKGKPPAKKTAASRDAIKRKLSATKMGPSDNDADDYPMK